MKKRLCTNDKCKFVHLTGTARKAPQNTKTGPNTNKGSNQRSKHHNNQGEGNDTDVSLAASFLELKALVQSMSTSFKKELASMKAMIEYPLSYPQLPAPPGFLPMPYHPLAQRSQLYKPAQPGGITIPPVSY